MKSIAYVGFGANLGNPEDTFYKALKMIGSLEGACLTKVSSLYKTDPVGLTDDGREFLNAVLEVQTDLAPNELMRHLRKIERSLGKHSSHKSDLSRKIDLDLLLFGNESFSANGLEVPHPRMNSRGFVLMPLAEIAPDLTHPKLKLTLGKMLDRLTPEEVQGVRLFKAANWLGGV